MLITVQIVGINLEKLLRAAPENGVMLFYVRREAGGAITAQVRARDMALLRRLCGRFGFLISEKGAGQSIRCFRRIVRRPMLLPAALLCCLMVWISSQMILSVRIEHAQENMAEARRFLSSQGVYPGRFKASFSLDALREGMALALPGVSFSGVRYAGSTMIVDCRPSILGENAGVNGEGMDIVARCPGIVTSIVASSGTPQVKIGQAVRRGQVLISGEERTEKGQQCIVRAQGSVYARTWARGEAKASLYQMHTMETGRTRSRVTLHAPGWKRVVRDALPFGSQDIDVRLEPVIGLYLPLWREIETYTETVVTRIPADRGDAASAAQGAAQELAKKQCPPGALILDKWVDYSMIDNEFVYATVILEYETSIAGRAAAP